jgi:multidrug transporter EmrE-like cation transporter
MTMLLATILIVLMMPISYAMLDQAVKKIRVKMGIEPE